CDHRRGVIGGELRIPGVQIRIVPMALEHALLQAIRHSHVRHAAVVGEHAPVTGQPVAALQPSPATNTHALRTSPVLMSIHSIGSPASSTLTRSPVSNSRAVSDASRYCGNLR